jgi:hypothetical protein
MHPFVKEVAFVKEAKRQDPRVFLSLHQKNEGLYFLEINRVKVLPAFQ